MSFGINQSPAYLNATVSTPKKAARSKKQLKSVWWRSASIPLTCSGLTLFASSSSAYPALLLAPISGLLLYLLRYEIKFFQSFPKQRWLLSAFTILLALGATWGVLTYTSEPAHAAFSFLFADTETALKNCVLKSVTAATVLAGIIFGGLRVAFMVGLGVAGYNIWTQRQQGQDYHDTLQIVLTAILVVVIIGAVEPLIVGTGGCGGS